MGDALLKPETVISGLIQGSVYGPIFFDLVLDSLLKSVKIPRFVFADDVKAVVCQDASRFRYYYIKWSLKNCMLISINKSSVLRCGNNNPRRNYELQGENLKPVENITDLEIIRTANSN